MKAQSYYPFWQRIHKSARDRGFPLRVMFELTYRCNFYCKHCYVPQSYRRQGELKTKEVFSILDQLADIGCFYLGFTGGEPFIREDILDILWYAKRLGFEVIVYTNGSLIDEDIAGELAKMRLNKVDITIPAMSKEAFESISGISGSRDRVFETIELLRKNKVNLGFKTCVLKWNESEINEILRFAESLGAQHRLDTMLSPRLDGSEEPFKYRVALVPLIPLLSDRQLYIKKCDSTEQTDTTDLTDKTKITDLFKCGVGVTQAAITPLGELKMCLMIDYPKFRILDSSLKDVWDRLKKLVENIKPDGRYKCNTCKLEPYCKWCPAKGWLEDKSFTGCTAESRTWAGYLKYERDTVQKI